MITICISGFCFLVAILSFRIGSWYGYLLCGVSCVVGALLFFNGLRLRKEKRENAKIAGKVQQLLGKFLFDCGFKAEGDGVSFNRPFIAFDHVSEQLLLGMPLAECVCVPFPSLLGFRVFEKGFATVESEDFEEVYDDIFPDADEDCLPQSKGLSVVFLFDDKRLPLFELEFAQEFYPKNSYFYRDELRRIKKYLATAENILQGYGSDEYAAGNVKQWKYEADKDSA